MVQRGIAIMYKQPPKHSQFKPGQSGNPRGRPRRINRDLINLTYRFFEALMDANAKRTKGLTKITQIKRILNANESISAKDTGRAAKDVV